jgi:hypothetical protein
MAMIELCLDLQRFVRGELEATQFPHREHVRMGFEMLRRHDFAETVFHFSSTLRAMAVRAGKPQAFHQTVTIAFLSLIAERIDSGDYADFDSFARANADLLDKSALSRWYPSERLATDAARRTFLLPEPAR